jgi:integrase
MSGKRNRRAGVEDRWTKTVRDEHGNTQTVPSAANGKGKRRRARYVDERGREPAKGFARKVDAQACLDKQTAVLVSGTHVGPRDANVTFSQWARAWLTAYAVNRESSVESARTHIRVIEATFGDMALADIRPSTVKTWVAAISATYLPSYVRAVYGRLSQILGDAAHDGLLPRNPCSRKTAPRGQDRPQIRLAATAQVWELVDAMPEYLRPAVLLGAFAGLRVGEVCGLRIVDVDFVRGVVYPKVQFKSMTETAAPLKTKYSAAPVPVSRDLTLLLSASVAEYGTDFVVTDGCGAQCKNWDVERGFAGVMEKVDGLPDGFRFHDLRHYYASVLIAGGCDVKAVQAAMRHGTASMTLDVYAGLWPDADDRARSAASAVLAKRPEAAADGLRTTTSQAVR